MSSTTWRGRELRSHLGQDGSLRLTLETTELPAPGAHEVIVRVDAAPLNPSDIGLLLGPADITQAAESGLPDAPVLTAPVAPRYLRALAGRVGISLGVGNEGAGTVVATGDGDGARQLAGRTVAVMAGAMYADYRCVNAADCLVIPAGLSATQAASSFVNPMTALGMLETMRSDGHAGLVHSAAASNLGQMLNRLCLRDDVPLVNIVRSALQADLLRSQGARYVCDSSLASFRDELVSALRSTGATLMFDAIGGGRLVPQVLAAMEEVASAKASRYSLYGTDILKQAYIYGGLDPGATELRRGFGSAWRIGGWLVFHFLARADAATVGRMRARVASELTTTFASSYEREIGLADVLVPAVAQAYAGRRTGGKFLVRPSLG